jgi:hypothetical protein
MRLAWRLRQRPDLELPSRLGENWAAAVRARVLRLMADGPGSWSANVAAVASRRAARASPACVRLRQRSAAALKPSCGCASDGDERQRRCRGAVPLGSGATGGSPADCAVALSHAMISSNPKICIDSSILSPKHHPSWGQVGEH